MFLNDIFNRKANSIQFIHMLIIFILFVFSFLSSIYLGIKLLHRRKNKGAFYLALAMFNISGWTISTYVELLSSTIIMKEIWLGITYVFVLTAPISFFAFSLDYTNKIKWLSSSKLFLLLVIPLTTFAALFFPETKPLVWEIVKINQSLNLGERVFGPLFWIYFSYGYLLVIVSLVLLFTDRANSANVFKKHYSLLIIASFFSFAANLIHVFNLTPYVGLDFTPIGLNLSCLIVYYGMKNFQVFNIEPIVKNTVINNLSNPIVGVDNNGLILYTNNPFDELFKFDSKKLIGLNIISDVPEYVKYYSNFDFKTCIDSDLAIKIENEYFSCKVNPIYSKRDSVIGTLLVFTNVTKIYLKEKEKIQIENQKNMQEQFYQMLLNNVLSNDFDDVKIKLLKYSGKFKTKTSEKEFLEDIQIFDKSLGKKPIEQIEVFIKDCYPDFYKKLLEINSDFSPRELQVCLLLSFNLTSKEIAWITKVETSTIEIYRHRIRKKLNISTEVSLANFINYL